MNQKLNNIAYRIGEDSLTIELVIDNLTRAKLYSDSAVGAVLDISDLAVSLTPEEVSKDPRVAKILLAQASLKKFREKIKYTTKLPLSINLDKPFDNKSEDSIKNTLEILKKIGEQMEITFDTALTINVNKFTSNTFYSKKDF